MKLYNIEERPEADRGDKEYLYLDMIKPVALHKFVISSINNNGTEEKLEEADKIADVLVQMLKKRLLITETNQQSIADILIAAAYIHNLFYDPQDWTSLYQARKILAPIAKADDMPQNVIDMLFSAVEAQMGESTPVAGSRPMPNHPNELLASAIWFIKEYTPQS
jgi:hypothetical protein